MSVRCPLCSAVAPVSDGDLSAAGRMVHCASCGTRWLARPHAVNPYRHAGAFLPAAAGPVEVADAIIIEHIAPRELPREFRSRHTPAAPLRLPMKSRIRTFGVGLAGLAAFVVFSASLVAAFPNAKAPPNADLLDFQKVRSETVELRGVRTLLVEGEIINHSGGDVALPAIRITLKSEEGRAVTSWLVEPAITGLAPGRTVGFRSALASPPAHATQVTLNLAHREGPLPDTH